MRKKKKAYHRSTQAEAGAEVREDSAEGMQWQDYVCLGQPGRSACIPGFVAGQDEGTASFERELPWVIPGGFPWILGRCACCNRVFGKVVVVEPCIMMWGLHLL